MSNVRIILRFLRILVHSEVNRRWVVDPVISKPTGMFLGLSKTESMTSWRSKTVSSIFIGWAFTPHEINILCQEARLVCRNHIHDTGFWTLWKAYESQCRNINRRLGNMADSALENWWFIFLSSAKNMVIRTHTQELHEVKCARHTQISTHPGPQRSQTDVDPVFSKLTGMFLGLSKTESMTLWRSKTVSSTFI